MRFSPVIMTVLVGLAGYYGLTTGCHRPVSANAFLPPPPVLASKVADEDRQIYLKTRQLAGSPRWQQAIHDAQINDRQTIQDFMTAGHIQLTEGEKRELAQRLERIQNAARDAMMREKDIWQRRRPFVDYGGQSCVIDHRRFIPSWSYPSGHTVRGYTIALALSAMFPEHKAALLAKAHEFAESRVICGMHWRSDVEAGAIFANKLFNQTENQKISPRG